ncbi:MAG: arsenate reductase family protein [Gemmatimonadales bacterium]
MDVQIFGLKKSSATRAALRFFAERRIKTHFVDFAVRGPSKGELSRFAGQFGIQSLIDRESRAFRDRGWGAARLPDTQWLDRLLTEPEALVMPLVRWQQRLTVGAAEDTWKAWVVEAAARPG